MNICQLTICRQLEIKRHMILILQNIKGKIKHSVRTGNENSVFSTKIVHDDLFYSTSIQISPETLLSSGTCKNNSYNLNDHSLWAKINVMPCVV